MTITAYHFVGETLRDGRPIPEDGVWLEFNDKPILCLQGLHASRHPFDALQYAPGQTLCLVEMGGEIVRGDDKLVATRRKIIKRSDLTETLRYFARMQAVSVLHLWDKCPPDCVLEYLMTGNESLRNAARAASSAAARAASWAAARAASWAAARAAARAAPCDAARAAARAEFKLLCDESLGVA